MVIKKDKFVKDLLKLILFILISLIFSYSIKLAVASIVGSFTNFMDTISGILMGLTLSIYLYFLFFSKFFLWSKAKRNVLVITVLVIATTSLVIFLVDIASLLKDTNYFDGGIYFSFVTICSFFIYMLLIWQVFYLKIRILSSQKITKNIVSHLK